MTSDERRIEPLERQDARLADCGLRRVRNGVDPLPEFSHEARRSLWHARRLAYLFDGRQDPSEVRRLERQNPTRAVEVTDGLGHEIVRHGSDVAEFLREDELGIEPG